MSRASIAIIIYGAGLGCSTNRPFESDAGTEADAAADTDGASATDDPCDDPSSDPESCDPPLGVLPPTPRDCAPETEWIYLIAWAIEGPLSREGDDAHLLKYQPLTGEVTVIGTVTCDVEKTMPYSMAVDRDGNAWVLLARGPNPGLFRVSTTDARCEPTPYVPAQGGYEEFGMGFAADGRDSTSERLYVVGGPDALIYEPDAETLFGTLDLETFTIDTIARIRGMAELTGTGEGNLWALQINKREGDIVEPPFPPLITRIDPTDGATTTVYRPQLLDAWAWAIAFWGGDFYVFVAPFARSETTIYRVRTRSGRTTALAPIPGHMVVGAGVSTCAPYELF